MTSWFSEEWGLSNQMEVLRIFCNCLLQERQKENL